MVNVFEFEFEFEFDVPAIAATHSVPMCGSRNGLATPNYLLGLTKCRFLAEMSHKVCIRVPSTSAGA